MKNDNDLYSWKEVQFDIWTASSVGDLDYLNSIIEASEMTSGTDKLETVSVPKLDQLYNLDVKNSGGWTCLMYAAYYDHANLARWLLEGNLVREYRGPCERLPVNSSIKNKLGKTSLMLAASCGHNETVDTILHCCKTSLSVANFTVHTIL